MYLPNEVGLLPRKETGHAYDLDSNCIDHGSFGLYGRSDVSAIECRTIKFDRNCSRAPDMDLAGATNRTKYLRLQAVISPGWLRQDERFLPYTTNEAITGCGGTPGASCTTAASLPASNLEGSKQTLAIEFTLVSLPWKNFQIKAGYRHYDYNNNTPVHTFTPTEGDASGPGSGEENTPFGFNRKNFELTGNWFFAKKSSAKLGYQVEWMDRSHRDVEHSM